VVEWVGLLDIVTYERTLRVAHWNSLKLGSLEQRIEERAEETTATSVASQIVREEGMVVLGMPFVTDSKEKSIVNGVGHLEKVMRKEGQYGVRANWGLFEWCGNAAKVIIKRGERNNTG